LGELSAQMQRQQEKLEQEEGKILAKEQALREAQTQRRRSERRLETLKRHVDKQLDKGERITATLRKEVKEQDSLAEALRDQSAQVDKKQRELDQAKAKQQQRQERQQERVERFSELQPRQQIYRHDVELDSLFGLLKVGLVFLVTYVLKEFFNGATMDAVTFLERMATLPARRYLTPEYEIVTFAYNRRDPEVMALLSSHSEAINARALRLRSGRILRVHIDPAPPPRRPPPAQRRANSTDRFHKRQPKV